MNGSVLLLQDVPENTELGIDLRSWKIGKNFRGIKNIPSGFHYVYFSAANAEFTSGQRTGFSVWFDKIGFHAKRWLPQEEDILLTSMDMERLKDNFDELSVYLGPYPSDSFRDWVALTNHITPLSLERLLPQCGRVNSCTQFVSEPSSSAQRLASAELTEAEPGDGRMEKSSGSLEKLLPKLDVLPGTELQFTQLPKQPLFPHGSIPTEITKHAIDQTYTLDLLLNSLISEQPFEGQGRSCSQLETVRPEEKELLSELQFSYVIFLLNHVLDGWYQWRKIFHLLANCEKAISDRTEFYIALITVLYRQLCNASQSHDFLDSKSADISTAELADLFFSEVTEKPTTDTFKEPAFLPTVISSLIRSILGCCAKHLGDESDSANKMMRLKERAEGFCHSIEERFHWGINLSALQREMVEEASEECVLVADLDWTSDEAPVIVQL